MYLIKQQEPYALQGCRSRWDTSSRLMKKRDPYFFENFTQYLTQVLGYAKCIWSYGINWLGMHFKFPILWFPDKKLKKRYMLTNKVERQFWEEFIACNGYKDREDKLESSFNITHLHRQIFDLDSDSY